MSTANGLPIYEYKVFPSERRGPWRWQVRVTKFVPTWRKDHWKPDSHHNASSGEAPTIEEAKVAAIEMARKWRDTIEPESDNHPWIEIDPGEPPRTVYVSGFNRAPLIPLTPPPPPNSGRWT